MASGECLDYEKWNEKGKNWYNLPCEEHCFSEGGEDLIMCRHSRVQDTKYATQLQWGLLLTHSGSGVNC